MSKIKLDPIAKAYPEIDWSGKTYKDLMTHIIANQSENVAKKTLQISHESIQKVLSKVKGEKRFVLPNVQEVLPKNSVFMRKAAEKGKLLSDTLRDRLNKNIRDALKEFGKTGEPSMVIRRGEMAGRVSPKLIKQFRDKITNTFEAYTKKDPEFGGVPRNIKSIAITELRSTIDDIKHQYIKRMANQNPDYEMYKKWVHNGHLSNMSRPGHVKLSQKKPIPALDYYKIPVYKKIDGKQKFTGDYIMALHPHDKNLPPEETISCNCDSEYVLRRKKGV